MDITEQTIKLENEKFEKEYCINLLLDSKPFNWYKKTSLTTYIRNVKFNNIRNVEHTIEILKRLCFEVNVASIIYHLENKDRKKINANFDPEYTEIDVFNPKILINNNTIEFNINE